MKRLSSLPLLPEGALRKDVVMVPGKNGNWYVTLESFGTPKKSIIDNPLFVLIMLVACLLVLYAIA